MTQLRAGDVVEVRPAAEILATLEADGALEAVPFMPEMLQYIGRRFTVSRRVEKLCDTISQSGSRRMENVVYLDDLRCDGSGHGGCQAGCRIYWKEAWLRRVDDAQVAAPAVDGSADLERIAVSAARTVREFDGEPEEVWRCQATDALVATEPLKTSDLRQYPRELTSRNVGVGHFVRVAARAFVVEAARRLRLPVLPALPLRGPETPVEPEPLGLQPGDLVQVRRPEEIAQTLDAKGLNRGLSFDREMLHYCGRTFRVHDVVKQIVDDRTGRMIHMKRACIILDSVTCSGERTAGCWFCPRAIYPYWREAWLRRVEA